MAPRTRTKAQRRKRAFDTRRQGVIKKVREMNSLTDAKVAVLGTYKGQRFWYDETGLLHELGTLPELQQGLDTSNCSSAGSVSSADSTTPSLTHSVPVSPDPSPRQSSEPAPAVAPATPPVRAVSLVPADFSLFGPENLSANTADVRMSSPQKTPEDQNSAGIASLDVDFFGLETENRPEASEGPGYF